MDHSDTLTIRNATEVDAADCLAIYAPHIREGTASFELDVPDTAAFARRIRAVQATHVWLVAERGSAVIGYAYGSPHREREAYRFSVETSVYIASAAAGAGVGRQLYLKLFDRLASLGYCQAYAGITLPNDPSIAFHRKLGFSDIGTFPKVGYKFGQWHDVQWWHRELRPGQPTDVAQ